MQIFKGDDSEPCTKHSINPVPCILFDPAFDGSYKLRQPQEGDDLSTTPGLSHLAATLFEVMGYTAPKDLNASLIEELKA
jgi:2,3-bisphosphoglycerate-independent phosphoglycerate mutase